MKERITVGYIFTTKRLSDEEKLFIKLAKRKNIELVLFNLAEVLNGDEIREKADRCDIIFNNTAGYLAIELVKTLEEMGKKVIDGSRIFYYTENKWIFYLKCEKWGISTPETILLPLNLSSVRKELEEFGYWPVILKRVNGEMGEFVDMAKTPDQAIKIIKNFWKKGNERLPIIAQEYIKSKCSYRVTVIGNKIIQGAVKHGNNWKLTGVYTRKCTRFRIDNDLEKLIKKVMKMCKIKVCGIDLLKRDGKWFVNEVNAEPAFDFFKKDRTLIINEVLDLLRKEA